MQPQRSASAGARRSTPPPRNVQELAEDRRRSASARESKAAASSMGDTARPRPSSPAPARTASSSRGSSPSRDQFHNLVRTTYFGYESNYPNEQDVARRERAQLFKPPKLVEKPLDPRFTNFRGHAKCRYCSLLVPSSEADAHQQGCSLAPVHCPLVDTETGVPCNALFRGRELLQEHMLKCGARTRRCENRGCGKLVSVQSTALHLQHCSFERVRCMHCLLTHLRSEESSHVALCPQALVLCPLGCGESVRRGDLVAHMHNTLLSHRVMPPVDPSIRPPDDPQSVIQFLFARLVEAHGGDVGGMRRRSHPCSAQPSRSATPTVGHGTVGGAAIPSANHLQQHPDEHPSSILHHADDDDSVINDGDTSSLRLAITAASRGAHNARRTHYANLGRGDVDPLEALSEQRNTSATSSVPPSSSATKRVPELIRTIRNRPKLDQPIQGIPFGQLHEYLVGELQWFRKELDLLVDALQSGGDNEAAPAPFAGGGTLADVDLAELLADVGDALDRLHRQVDVFTSRTTVGEGVGVALGDKGIVPADGMQDDVALMWRGVEMLWYEWKLAMYERMYKA